MNNPLLGSSDGSHTPATAPKETTSYFLHRRQVLACILLHILLVLVHVTLLIIWSHHYEHSLVFSFTTFTSDWLSTIVTSIAQTIGVLYLAVLVLLTQRLALRIELYTVQTLTAIHDKTNAWLGLGSAAVSVWQQTKVPAALSGVTCITVYLAAVFALHITIPAMFNVAPFNATMPTAHQTQLANASFDYNATSALDILSFYGQFSTPGLLGNMVYDVIPTVPAAVGSTSVNASVYEVACSGLPNVSFPVPGTFTASSPEEINYSVQYKNWTSSDSKLPSASSIWSVDSWGFVTSPTSTEVSDVMPSIVMLSTVPIIDSTGASSSESPWTSLDPLLFQSLNGYEEIASEAMLITGLQSIACSVSVNNVHINVSAETGQPLLNPHAQTSVKWKNETQFPNDPTVPTSQDPRVQMAHNAVQNAGEAQGITVLGGVVNNSDAFHPNASAPQYVSGQELSALQNNSELIPFVIVRSTFDLFVMGDLGFVSENKTNLSLADIEFSMGKAFAAIYWYGRNYNYSEPHGMAIADGGQLLRGSTVNVNEGQGEAMITISTLKLRLNLSLAPIIAGLVASSMLFALCLALVRPHGLRTATSNTHAAFDSTGVLQLTWLLGREPRINALPTPESTALRHAGMFNVQMSAVAEQRLGSSLSLVTANLKPLEEKRDDASMESYWSPTI